jgi:ectoine hydroxylase-related dioxygenase (phytanoyl-CoA dioxygenase family)
MHDDGFWIEQNVLTPSECDSLITVVIENAIKRGRAGARNLMAVADVAALANDPRVMRIAALAFDKPVIPYRATFFDKSIGANWLVAWHQDTMLPLVDRFDSREWGLWSKKSGVLFARAPTWALSRVVALRIHLDSSTTDNGPLRVIPMSHRFGVLSSEEVLTVARRRNTVECLASRGGVIALSPLLIHSSSRGNTKSPRRVIHIEYADSLRLAENIELATA